MTTVTVSRAPWEDILPLPQMTDEDIREFLKKTLLDCTVEEQIDAPWFVSYRDAKWTANPMGSFYRYCKHPPKKGWWYDECYSWKELPWEVQEKFRTAVLDLIGLPPGLVWQPST